MSRWFQALDKGWIANLSALLLPLAVAAALVPFRSNFALPASALVLALVVVAVGSFGSRLAGVLAALSAAAWFDFFLTKPYETFNITYRPDLQTEISLLVVGLAITEIAARSRGHREAASEEAHNVALIHDFTEMVASGEPAQFVVARAAAELTSLLRLRDCRFDTEMSDRHPTRHRALRCGRAGRVALGRAPERLAGPGGRAHRSVSRRDLRALRHDPDARRAGVIRPPARRGLHRRPGGRGALGQGEEHVAVPVPAWRCLALPSPAPLKR